MSASCCFASCSRRWDIAMFVSSVFGQWRFYQPHISLSATQQRFHHPAVINVCQTDHPAGDDAAIAGTQQQLLSVIPAAMIAPASLLSAQPMAIMAHGSPQTTVRHGCTIHNFVYRIATKHLPHVLLQQNKPLPDLSRSPVKLTVSQHCWKPLQTVFQHLAHQATLRLPRYANSPLTGYHNRQNLSI